MKQTKETISKRIFNSMFKTGTLTAFTLVGAGGAFPIADSTGRFFVEPDGCAPVYLGKDPKRSTAEELGGLCSSRYA